MAKPVEVVKAPDKYAFNYHCKHCKNWKENVEWYEPSNEAAKVMAAALRGDKVDDNDRLFLGPYCSEKCLKAENFKMMEEVEDAGEE